MSTFNILDATVVSVGGTSAIILGLSSWLGNILSKKIIASNNAKFEKELSKIKAKDNKDLESLKSKLDHQIKRAEQFHSISQKTYEELFRKKIELYSCINSDITDYYRTLKEDGDFALQDYPPSVYYSFFCKLRKSIENNRLYISDDLSNKYDILYNKIAPIIQELDIETTYHQINNLEEKDYEGLLDINDSKHNQMVTETSKQLQDVLNQVNKDISLLRSKIDLSNY